MKLLITAFLLLGFVSQAHAVAVAINRRDVKFPTQQMVEKQSFTNPIASAFSYVLSASAGPTSAAAASVTTFAAQPDVPRNLEISPGGTTGDIEACNITVTGTDYKGDALTEGFQFAANATQKQVGWKAFKTVSSVAFAANCESGGFAATWSVGVGERLGLKRCMAKPGDFLFSTVNGDKEATAPAMVASSGLLASNSVDFNGVMNGVSDFVLYFFSDFSCE